MTTSSKGSRSTLQELDRKTLPPVENRQTSVEALVDLDRGAGEGPALDVGQDLQVARAQAHRVVIGDGPAVLEAADRVQIEGTGDRAKGRRPLGRRTGEAAIVANDVAREESVGAGEVADAGKAELTDQAILKGAPDAFDAALRLRRGGRDPGDAQFLERAADLRGIGAAAQLLVQRERRAVPAFEDAVAVRVDRDREPMGGHQVAEEQQVAGGILALAEDGAQDPAGSVVDRMEQDERRAAGLQPGVMAAVHLDQEAGLTHALPPLAVLGRAAAPWTTQARGAENAMHGRVREDELFALSQELHQMAVIHPRVGRPSEVDEPLPDGGAHPTG